jgi:hypothetical protein
MTDTTTNQTHEFTCESAASAQNLISAELERGISHLLGLDSITPSALKLRDDVTLIVGKHPGFTVYSLDSKINSMLWTVLTVDEPKYAPDADFPEIKMGRIEWRRDYLEYERGEAVQP